MDLKQLIGQNLTNWRIEKWYELRFSPIGSGRQNEITGYFTDENLASAAGKGKAWFGSDGTVKEVLVLTTDGKTGFIIQDNNQIKPRCG